MTAGNDEQGPGPLLSASILDLVAEQLAAGSQVPFTVITGSMAPLLLPGDRTLVGKSSGQQLAVGDIVLVGTSPRPLVHRIVGLTTDGAIRLVHTKGDAVARGDTPVGSDSILGVVTGIERGPRRLRLDTRRAQVLGHGMARLSRWHERAAMVRIPPWAASLHAVCARASRSWAGGLGCKGEAQAGGRDPFVERVYHNLRQKHCHQIRRMRPPKSPKLWNVPWQDTI